MMKYILCQIFSFLLLGLFFAGCSDPMQSLTPNDTIVGTQASSLERDDWINPEQMAAMQGLKARDSSILNPDAIRSIQNSIFFEFDNFSLQPSQHATLAQTADYLKRNTGSKVLLEGHCDWHGTTEYNLALGDKRAATVKACLTQAGIEGHRLQTLSKGSLEATTSLTKQEAVRDRRVDIIVLN